MSETEAERPRSAGIGPIRGVFPFIRPYRVMAFGALVALVITAGLSLSLPLAVRRVIDGFNAESAELMDAYFAVAILIAAMLALGTGLRFYLVTRLGERVVADVRKAVYNKVIGMSPAFFERILTGEVLSRLTTDTTLILATIGSSVSVALRNFLTLIGGLIFMLLTSTKLSVLVLLIVPLVIVPIVTLGRRLRRLSRDSQDRIADTSGMASETLLAAQTVQAYTHEPASQKAYGDLTDISFETAKQRIGTRTAMTVFVIFIVFSGVVGVLWIGARDVRAGGMTPGELVQFVIYSVMVAGAVGSLSEIWGELLRTAGATERLIELLETEDKVAELQSPARLPATVKGEIAFENVHFRYPARPEIPAIDEVGFTISPGETVALVGPSGAGKSTVFQLLLRFFDPDSGNISLDGVPVSQLSFHDLRSQFALVPQEPVIFADSAKENIRFGRPDASDAEVEAAAKAAAADEFLSRLPKGYDTYVGERGVMLSGGQKQRIAIARAILRDAPILLLDEATSALDAESERAVQNAVEKLSESRTTLVIAHRLATVKKADRILVFDQGHIVAEGTHAELVAQDGRYARLARMQFTD